jgi:hypothetical protein
MNIRRLKASVEMGREDGSWHNYPRRASSILNMNFQFPLNCLPSEIKAFQAICFLGALLGFDFGCALRRILNWRHTLQPLEGDLGYSSNQIMVEFCNNHKTTHQISSNQRFYNCTLFHEV